jgi:acyl carrier protein
MLFGNIIQRFHVYQGVSMPLAETVKMEVFAQIVQLLEDKALTVTDDMPLIGGESVLDSMTLVELCLTLEDKAADMGFEFDWTSEAAMSRSRSMFRTAGALAAEFIHQMESKQ